MSLACRRHRLSTLKISLILILFIAALVVLEVDLIQKSRYYFPFIFNSNWIKEREKLILNYQRRYEADRLNKREAVCQIPHLNAFSDDVLMYMEKSYATCDEKRFGKIEMGAFILPAKGKSDVILQYITRSRKDNDITEDNAVKLSKEIFLKERNGYYTHSLIEDTIKVQMYLTDSKTKHVEYHTHITKNTNDRKSRIKIKDLKTGIPLNIIHVMIDSQSHTNFERQLVEFMPLVYDDENTIILKGQGIVADGTTGQILAAFTGHTEDDLPESRRGFPNSAPVDDFPWIFKKFEKIGYSTLFSETDPKYATFNYRLHGFRNPPSTHYTRPYWLGQMNMEKQHYCNVKYNLNILKEFTMTYEQEAKFAYCAFGQIGHDDMNRLQAIDKDLVDIFQFYKDPIRINNTILIIFGDHGARAHGKYFRSTWQGALEERLPFFSITLPPTFKRLYPSLYENLKWNSQYLTSPFDLYPTYEHLMMYPDQPANAKYVGSSLFTHIDPLNRTCESCGIKDHWCPCFTYESVDKNVGFVRRGALDVVNEINRLVSKIGKHSTLCAKLKLKRIVSASLLKLSSSILTKKPQSQSSKKIQITFETAPGNGLFEANLEIAGDSTKIDPDISRTNFYGTDPECIADAHPHLRPYCYCVSKNWFFSFLF